MSTKKLSNISLKDFRKFLKNQGLNIIKTSKGRGGHEKWSRTDLDRPVTIQTHIPLKAGLVQLTILNTPLIADFQNRVSLIKNADHTPL